MNREAAKQHRSGSAVPSAAAWFGGLGAVPFAALAGAVSFLEETARGQCLFALAAYGAVILSFLGGVQWGVAIAQDDASLHRLGFSVIPSLAGWGALLLLPEGGLFVMALAFALMLVSDIRAGQVGETPDWYPRLRWPLTAIVVASLVLGAFSV